MYLDLLIYFLKILMLEKLYLKFEVDIMVYLLIISFFYQFIYLFFSLLFLSRLFKKFLDMYYVEVVCILCNYVKVV